MTINHVKNPLIEQLFLYKFVYCMNIVSLHFQSVIIKIPPQTSDIVPYIIYLRKYMLQLRK